MKNIFVIILLVGSVVSSNSQGLSSYSNADFKTSKTISNTTQRNVFVNDQKLTNATINLFENYYRIKIKNGKYWYDKHTGIWGIVGYPASGIILPNLRLGGRLKSNASNGRTGVFINNRQLHYTEVAYLKRFGTVYKGRYWMNAQGYVGLEGQGAFVNLYALMKQNNSSNNFYRNNYTGIGTGGSGKDFYVIGKDFSY